MKKSRSDAAPRWDDVQEFSQSARRPDAPYFAIYASKYMLLSASFVRKYLRDNLAGKHALLFYSRSNRALLVQFSDRAGEHTVRLNQHHANLTLHIARISRSFNLDAAALTGKYVPELVQVPGRGPCWCIYLDRRIR